MAVKRHQSRRLWSMEPLEVRLNLSSSGMEMEVETGEHSLQDSGYGSEHEGESESEFSSSFLQLMRSATESTGDEDVLEDPVFEELESLVEDAHETGSQVSLEDHHVAVLDDVISHLADELLVSTQDLHALVIPPLRQTSNSTSETSSDRTTLVDGSPEEETSTAVNETDEDAEKTSTNAITTSLISPDTKALTDTNDRDQSDSDGAMIGEQDSPAGNADSQTGSTGVEDTSAEGIRVDSTAPSGDSTTYELLEQNRQSPDQGSAADLNSARTSATETNSKPDSFSGLAIRYGDAMLILRDGTGLSFDPGQAPEFLHGTTAAATIVPGQGSVSLLAAIALGTGVFAASDTERTAAVHKVIRRIRRHLTIRL